MLIILFQIIIIFMGIYVIQSKDAGIFGFLITAVFLFSIITFTGLRWTTGTDWQSYFFAHYLISGGRADLIGGTFEIGYRNFMIFVSIFSNKFSIFLLIQSFLCVYILYYSARIINIPVLLFVALVFLDQSQFWYPVRQQLATSITVFATCMLWSVGWAARPVRRNLFGVAGAAFSPLVHMASAPTMALNILLARFSWRLKGALGLGGILIMILNWEALFNLFFSARVDTYLVQNDYDFSVARTYARIVEKILSLFIGLYLLFNLKFTIEQGYMKRGLYAFVIVGAILSIFSLIYFPYLARLASYFSWVSAIIICLVLMQDRNERNGFSNLLCYIWIFILLGKFVLSLASYWDLLDPFIFVWENKERMVY